MQEEDLTEKDFILLDEAQNVLNECNGASSVQLPTHQQEASVETTEITNVVDSSFCDFADCFEDDENEVQMEHIECLKSKFHNDSFREKQWDIIKTLNDKRDVCAVMATGYGKSLCYQFPAVYKNRMTLVISPFISQMQGQVFDLKSVGISACLLGSAQPDNGILHRIADGQFTVVYCTPEYLQTPNGNNLLSIVREKLVLVAIDEAHCVSQRGHKFRPAYQKLNIIKQKLPGIPILAVTATATENVRHDIITLLGLNEPAVIMSKFDRPNLELIVKRKTSVRNDLVGLVKDTDGSVIVYVLKKKNSEYIAALLLANGVDCDFYHGDMNNDKRTDVLHKFLEDDLKVIVATNAFGVDKKDIRCVIHYGAAKNLESYYQEVGRAGRDGKPSKVVTFFGPEDFTLHDYSLKDDTIQHKFSSVIEKYLRRLAAKMRSFLYSTQCRRKIILEYFGENTELTLRPNCCDNCRLRLSYVDCEGDIWDLMFPELAGYSQYDDSVYDYDMNESDMDDYDMGDYGMGYEDYADSGNAESDENGDDESEEETGEDNERMHDEDSEQEVNEGSEHQSDLENEQGTDDERMRYEDFADPGSAEGDENGDVESDENGDVKSEDETDEDSERINDEDSEQEADKGGEHQSGVGNEHQIVLRNEQGTDVERQEESVANVNADESDSDFERSSSSRKRQKITNS